MTLFLHEPPPQPTRLQDVTARRQPGHIDTVAELRGEERAAVEFLNSAGLPEERRDQIICMFVRFR
jgi:hypothetical protein